MAEEGHIAVDFDGTLARYDGFETLGPPLAPMERHIKEGLKLGQKFKIFTARAHDPAQVKKIKAWLKQYEFPDLEVTNIKCPNCIEIWDDKARQVKFNTGRFMTPMHR